MRRRGVTVRVTALVSVVATMLVLGVASAGAASWRPVSVPLPAGATSAGLNGVSCARARLCWAVGLANFPGHDKRAFIERWNGQSWAVVPIALPAQLGRTGLFGVSCSAPTACMAVGGTTEDRGGTLALQWRGGAWREVPAPSPSDTTLEAVSCSSPSHCLAVGSTDTFKDGIFNYSLNLVWNGSAWTKQPDSETGSLNAVSCVSATFCAGVGLISDSAGNNSVAELWNGHRIVDLPSGDGRAGSLQGVSCPSASFCLVLGTSFGPIAVRWDGRRWQSLASPAGLDAVSCPESTRCVATGRRIATWNGASWSLAPASVTAGDFLDGVTCRGVSSCLAVGYSGARPVALSDG